MKRTHNGRVGSIAVAWRPVSSSRISLPIEFHSLFLITGNLSLWRWKRWGILDQIAPGESDIDKFPCIFPGHQGFIWRDEFATDWFHRHLVRGRGDFRRASRVRPRNARDSAGLGRSALAHPNRRRRVPGLGRRSPCLSLLPDWPVRIRFRFAPARGGVQQIYQHPHRSRMVGDRGAQNESVSRNWAGELSASGR
jgi:hypothetical protein